MAERDSTFERLIEEVRQGSEPAARKVIEIYGDHILRVVRRTLLPRLRSRYDSADFQQAVWASFFAIPRDRVKFSTPEELAVYLGAMADHKVAEAFRQGFGTRKRNLNREKGLDQVGEQTVAARINTPTASQAAMAEEQWEQLVRGKPPVVRAMLALLREGHSYNEVARRTGLHVKAIQRFVRKLRERIHR